jgi:hypothetical protein
MLLLLVRQPSPSPRTGELREQGTLVRMSTYAWMDGWMGRWVGGMGLGGKDLSAMRPSYYE